LISCHIMNTRMETARYRHINTSDYLITGSLVASTTEIESNINLLYKFQFSFYLTVNKRRSSTKIKTDVTHSLWINWYNWKGMLFLHTFET
jgi:hypothetical protein